MTNNSPSVKQNLLLLLISILVVVLFAEVVLRVVLPSPIVWKYPQEQYQFDGEIGHWLESNQQAYTHDKLVITNASGIRGADINLEKSSDVYRILALGDSQTFGNGLEISDTWPKQLETYLNESTAGKRVEVINAGLPGSDTWQHEIIMRRLLPVYQPDAVILLFYVNDVVVRPPAPVWSKGSSQIENRISYILKSSSLLLTIRTVWNSVNQMWSPSKGMLQQQALLQGEDTAILSKRWGQVQTSLSNMKKMEDEHNMTFSVAMLPRRDQIDGRLSWDKYSAHIQEITDQNEIAVVDLLPPLQKAYEAHAKALFIPWDGHNTKTANRVIAKKIADKLVVVGR